MITSLAPGVRGWMWRLMPLLKTRDAQQMAKFCIHGTGKERNGTRLIWFQRSVKSVCWKLVIYQSFFERGGAPILRPLPRYGSPFRCKQHRISRDYALMVMMMMELIMIGCGLRDGDNKRTYPARIHARLVGLWWEQGCAWAARIVV